MTVTRSVRAWQTVPVCGRSGQPRMKALVAVVVEVEEEEEEVAMEARTKNEVPMTTPL